MHSACKYLLCIRIKCCLHMHIKIAMPGINSLLLFRLTVFKNHYPGKKIEKKSTLEVFKLVLCFIILCSGNSFAVPKPRYFFGFFFPQFILCLARQMNKLWKAWKHVFEEAPHWQQNLVPGIFHKVYELF